MTFVEFAKLYGLVIDRLVTNEITRCPTIDHPETKNGAYLLSEKNSWVMNWSIMKNPVVFSGLVHTDIVEFGIPKEAPKNNQECIKRCEFMLMNSSYGTHPYLEKKGIEEKVNLYMGNIVVPVNDYITNELGGAQLIYPKDIGYQKKFVPGTKLKYGVYVLPGTSNSGHFAGILCEGLATGMSVWTSIKKQLPVIVCFCASNLVNISRMMQEMKETGMLYADNDDAGIEAARITKLPWVCSDEKQNDANDDMVKFGKDYVYNKVRSKVCISLE